ncbi:hypothetical protein Agabi119p4_2956 [Agaricus bisporus var. burnettii]|uniref:DNA 3'-5' helicase n=1 Tax=Agaricus bisporus var. burnettii TaxID=192524 RepID=A0A8H7KIW1_AGABI|nr:hypothetical protein Agabi119p4_2956 [Agaricus bisporus var. burnettii]
MQPNFSDSYHDYLDLMDPQMDSVTVFDTGPTFGVSEDDFDDYLNQLMTSSPSPPQRPIESFRSDTASSNQSAPCGSGFSAAHQGGSRPLLPTRLISRMNDNVPPFSGPSGNAFHSETYSGANDPSDGHVRMLESRNQVENSSRHPGTIIDDRERGTEFSRNSMGFNQGSRPLVSDLPDLYRGIFKFPAFNAMQTRCFDHIMTSNRDLVVSAPTGSGKTVLFELAIVALLSQADPTRSKAVYMAPTKALCSERFRDWSGKFNPLGIEVCELTGDTVQFGRSAWGDAKKSCIIITTAEKWDSLTRTWRDHESILSQIKLFLVDEVHVLNETRGSTLEVVISRMKTRNECIRFLLVSATVPNIRDIADWMDNSRESNTCEVLEFGEEYRPCRLTRFVIGVPRSNKQNEFQYAATLNNQLFPVLQQYSVMKPILIFCSTRKGTLTSAGTLLKSYEEAAKQKQRLPWVTSPQLDARFHDKRLQELATYGIGVHHAGLGLEDRRSVEELFLGGTIRVLVATSTLSVGVNLPAHTVIIQGVKLFQNNTHVEYSDLDIMQMIGRAGRPQFDKDGIAIIMCEPQLVSKYQALTQGKTVLESSLHHNMLEHLNSEIALGTITNLQSAKSWLHNSFLYQRLRKNPSHYALHQDTSKNWHERLEDIVLQNVGRLEATQLVCRTEDDQIQPTDYGDIMSKFYVRQMTMANILNFPDKSAEKPTLREILETIAAAEEFSSLRMRASEKLVYNELRTHNDIRYAIKKVEKTSDKVFLLIQAILGNIPLNTPEMRRGDTQPQADALFIFKHAVRLAKVIVEVAIVKQLGTQLLNGLEALRCLNAKAWEDRATVLRQIDQIGEKSLKVLAEHGITTLDLLRQQPPARIEILLNRKSPFGHVVLDSLAELPKYRIKVSQTSVMTDNGKNPVRIKFSIECELVSSASAKVKKFRYHDVTAILSLTSDYDLIDFRRISTKALRERKSFDVVAELVKPSQTIIVMIASESFAGTLVRSVVRPDVPVSEFPTPDTRPLSTLALDLKEFENDPNFWNMKFDEADGSDTADTRNSASQNIKSGEKSNQKDQPPKLRDDNDRCKHTCTDKLKCLHLCCKKVKQYPERKKGKNNPSDAKGRKELRDRQSIGDATHNGRSHVHERQIRDLERIHEKSDVQNSLKMKKEHRLKLDTTSSESRKRKIKPSFDIHFTEVEAQSNANKVIETTLDNDELPSIEQLLSGELTSGIGTEVQGLLQRDNLTPHKRPRLSLATQAIGTRDNTGERFSQMPLDTLNEVGNHYAEVAKPVPEKDEFDELEEWLASGRVEIV